MNKIIIIMLGLMICGGILCNGMVEAKGIKLKDYVDPYNRYSIKYPAKWSVISEPVHTEGNYLYEVPFKVGDNKGATMTVQELKKDPVLSLREFASVGLNLNTLVTRIINPIECFGETCWYFTGYSLGIYNDEIGQLVTIKSGLDNKVFMVTATFSTNEHISGTQFAQIEESLTLKY